MFVFKNHLMSLFLAAFCAFFSSDKTIFSNSTPGKFQKFLVSLHNIFLTVADSQRRTLNSTECYKNIIYWMFQLELKQK